MDIFIEQLVKRSSKGIYLLMKIGIVIGALALSGVLLLYSPYILGSFATFGFMLGFGVLYLGYMLLTSLNVEFEYIITNGEVDVDKIVAQRKRTRLENFKCKEVEAIGLYKKAEHANRQYGKVIKACIDENDEKNTWYVNYRSPKNGNTLLIFTPSNEVLKTIKPILPRLLQKDVQLWD